MFYRFNEQLMTMFLAGFCSFDLQAVAFLIAEHFCSYGDRTVSHLRLDYV